MASTGHMASGSRPGDLRTYPGSAGLGHYRLGDSFFFVFVFCFLSSSLSFACVVAVNLSPLDDGYTSHIDSPVLGNLSFVDRRPGTWQDAKPVAPPLVGSIPFSSYLPTIHSPFCGCGHDGRLRHPPQN